MGEEEAVERAPEVLGAHRRGERAVPRVAVEEGALRPPRRVDGFAWSMSCCERLTTPTKPRADRLRTASRGKTLRRRCPRPSRPPS